MIWADKSRQWFLHRPVRKDVASIGLLTLLWAFYFWRVLTPNPVNQVSLPEGDFSGQFLAFGSYQSERLLAGEIPLWNPYNNAGHPFLADPQSAVFYPPRLVTIVVAQLLGGWGYAALQAEVIVHFWLASVLMYAFVTSITQSRTAGIVSALVATYGGYLTGYPPLQVAVLEAGIWLPLALVGVQRSSLKSHGWHPGWLAVSALALGFSLLAGHPQTSLFMTYVLSTYIVHRAVVRRFSWRQIILGLVLVIGLGFGLASVHLLPGLEYMRLTTRAALGFDALSGGFPFSDLITFFIPNVLTTWSPLYNGIATLALAFVALARRQESARFWALVMLIALGLSFGGATALYRLAYLIAPGFALFRGQERAACVIAYSLAILAGLGITAIQRTPDDASKQSKLIAVGASIAWLFALEVFVAERLLPQADLFDLLKASFFLAVLFTLTWLVVQRLPQRKVGDWWSPAIVALVAFDLFSVTMGTNWERIPAADRIMLSDLARSTLDDHTLYRIDAEYGFGHRGPGENYGTLAHVQDIRGTSPLKLAALNDYLRLPKYRLHQLLSVAYVFTDWQQLEVPTTLESSDPITTPPVYVHRIEEPLPRAWMVYQVMVSPDRNQMLGWLADPGFDPRTTAVLGSEPTVSLPETPPEDVQVAVEGYEPEYIRLNVDTPEDGLLVVSEWYYPGWTASIDGTETPILETNAGLRGLFVPAGTHNIEFAYRPLSVMIGAVVTILSLIGLTGMLVASRTARQSSAAED